MCILPAEREYGPAVRPELVEGSDGMKIAACHQRALWPRGATKRAGGDPIQRKSSIHVHGSTGSPRTEKRPLSLALSHKGRRD